MEAKPGRNHGPGSAGWESRKPGRHGADERRTNQQERPMQKKGGTQHDGGKPAGKGTRLPSPGGHH